ncbi:putative Ribonuclease H-like domain-containing protein [Seiridium cardinale]
MPLGWYLAQGLYPIGPSSSDDEEGPCELPNGRLVCGPHGLVTCGRCCTDYSFMEDVPSDGENDGESNVSDTDMMYEQLSPERRAEIDARWGPPHPVNTQANASVSQPRGLPADMGPEKRRGIGRAFPTKFFPPDRSILPTKLFPGQITDSNKCRYVHRNNPQKILIFTDGACLNNGQLNPRAGWGFVYGPGILHRRAVVSGRLESQGPFGDESAQTSNRAEIRAVIAALRFRDWADQGYRAVVIATDSEYAVEGSTKWVKTWLRNGWKTQGKAEVKNRDLWEMLLGEVERWQEKGLTVQFWKIPRDWNRLADAAAKDAAAESHVPSRWTECSSLPEAQMNLC